jgi:hypothetical protein
MYKKLSVFLTALVGVFFLNSCGEKSKSGDGADEHAAWNRINDPAFLNKNYIRTFASLPTFGKLPVEPWSDTYWPTKEGGIFARWYGSQPAKPFTYLPPTREQVMAMSRAEIERLSPAEKYDLYVGNYNYPLVSRERKRTKPSAPRWWGICHGWAPAALHFTEPKPVTVVGANGVEIPFWSSDIKALLSYYQGEIARPRSVQLGGRCDIDLLRNPRSVFAPECRDTNAGAFHLVVTNQLGLLKQGFIMDATRDLQVWNQPVFAFRSNVKGTHAPSRGSSRGTVKEVEIETRLYFTVEGAPQALPRVANRNNLLSFKDYFYRVELDRDGRIIGGAWKSILADRPDFLWLEAKAEFAGYFSRLGEIYKASTL